MLFFNVWVLSPNLIENSVKKAIGHFHDIIFCEASDLTAIVGSSVLKSVANDLFTAGASDQLEALHDLGSLLVLDTCVEIFFIFSDDDDVELRMLCFYVREV